MEIIEDLGGQDLIFVTDATTTIRWYDIDTHTEVGSATQGQVAVSLGVFVNDNDYPVLFSGTVAVHGLPHGPNLVKYDTEAGQQTNVQLGGGSARGIAVNQQNERVYANVGPALGPFGQSTVRVYSIDPFEELSRVTIEGFGLSPTDLDATWLAFGSNVKKESTSHPDGTVNMTEEVVFRNHHRKPRLAADSRAAAQRHL
ncbi:MAG: hypothetical protein M5R36_07265 [Deltaproteobacteria bacterium]|nr:hypothetical protein [Deltaproteobacteria bacterium]